MKPGGHFHGSITYHFRYLCLFFICDGSRFFGQWLIIVFVIVFKSAWYIYIYARLPSFEEVGNELISLLVGPGVHVGKILAVKPPLSYRCTGEHDTAMTGCCCDKE